MITHLQPLYKSEIGVTNRRLPMSSFHDELMQKLVQIKQGRIFYHSCIYFLIKLVSFFKFCIYFCCYYNRRIILLTDKYISDQDYIDNITFYIHAFLSKETDVMSCSTEMYSFPIRNNEIFKTV